MAPAVTNDSGGGGGCRRWGGRIIPDRHAPEGRRWPGPCSPEGHGITRHRRPGDFRRKTGLRGIGPQGYAILATRYRTRAGEIDIVASDGDTLVFVEVKTRSSEDFGIPAEAVTWRKQRRIVAMARWYLSEKRLHGCLCRFDVVTVLWRPGRPPVLEVVKNAFLAS